jgi:hypothetical protein
MRAIIAIVLLFLGTSGTAYADEVEGDVWTQKDLRVSACKSQRKQYRELWDDQEVLFKCEGAVIVERWKLYKNGRRVGYIRYYKDKDDQLVKTVVDK